MTAPAGYWSNDDPMGVRPYGAIQLRIFSASETNYLQAIDDSQTLRLCQVQIKNISARLTRIENLLRDTDEDNDEPSD